MLTSPMFLGNDCRSSDSARLDYYRTLGGCSINTLDGGPEIS